MRAVLLAGLVMMAGCGIAQGQSLTDVFLREPERVNDFDPAGLVI